LESNQINDELDGLLLYLSEAIDYPFEAVWKRPDGESHRVNVEASVAVSESGVLMKLQNQNDDDELGEAVPAEQLYVSDESSIPRKVLDDHRLWLKDTEPVHRSALDDVFQDIKILKYGNPIWPWPYGEGELSDEMGIDYVDPAVLISAVKKKYDESSSLPNLPVDYSEALKEEDSSLRLFKHVIPPGTLVSDHLSALKRYCRSALKFPFEALWRETPVTVTSLASAKNRICVSVVRQEEQQHHSHSSPPFSIPLSEIEVEDYESIPFKVLSDYRTWLEGSVLVRLSRLQQHLKEAEELARLQ